MVKTWSQLAAATFLIPAGTWQLAGAFGTTLVVGLGAYTWTRDRGRSFDLQESDQARRAGAISSGPTIRTIPFSKRP